MNWYWRVRIYNAAGDYWHGQIITGRDLREIDNIQEFYKTLTGCKMLLEGMSERSDEDITPIQKSFEGLWCQRSPMKHPNKDRDDKAKLAFAFSKYLSVKEITAALQLANEAQARALVARGMALAVETKEGAS